MRNKLWRQSRAFLVALPLFVVAVWSVGRAETILIDNFNDGDDDVWTQNAVVAGIDRESVEFDASGGTYRITTTETVPPIGIRGGRDVLAHSTWDDTQFQDGFVRVKLRVGQDTVEITQVEEEVLTLLDPVDSAATAPTHPLPDPVGAAPSGISF